MRERGGGTRPVDGGFVERGDNILALGLPGCGHDAFPGGPGLGTYPAALQAGAVSSDLKTGGTVFSIQSQLGDLPVGYRQRRWRIFEDLVLLAEYQIRANQKTLPVDAKAAISVFR